MPISSRLCQLPRRWLLWIGLGIGLRLIFIWIPRPWDPDVWDYLQLGHNLLHHGIYGVGSGSDITPTLFRLPGYPIILGVFQQIFAPLWPNAWWKVLFLAQSGAEIAGGLMLAAMARRHISERAGEIALALAMLCPLTAAYDAIPMTECLSIFAVSAGIYAAAKAIAAEASGKTSIGALLGAGGAAALAMLLRPDGAVLFVSLAAGVFVYTWRARGGQYPQKDPRRSLGRSVASTAILCVAALLPLVPWTVRNYVRFQVFQPLAPRYINDPGQRVNTGFYRWLRTWAVEYVTTANVAWNAGQDTIDPEDILPGAYDSEAQRAQTLALIGEYNQTKSISAALDNKFGALADARIRAHPIRYYVTVPVLRATDMLLRPRTELFYLDVFWWNWSDHPGQSAWAILLGLINLFYVVAAAWAFIRRRVPWAWMLGGYLVLRLALLGCIEHPEPRYTLECFPILIVAAAAAFASKKATASTASSGGEATVLELAVPNPDRVVAY